MEASPEHTADESGVQGDQEDISDEDLFVGASKKAKPKPKVKKLTKSVPLPPKLENVKVEFPELEHSPQKEPPFLEKVSDLIDLTSDAECDDVEPKKVGCFRVVTSSFLD